MPETVQLDKDQARLLIAVQYLNASEWIFAGLKQQHKVNIFHFVITLRSFIEYTRRGIWFLCWANPEKIKEARKLTFEKPGSPSLVKMDEMINEALGKGRVSHLAAISPGINEPFLDSLHALTHGNPISARMISFGLEQIFKTEMLLAYIFLLLTQHFSVHQYPKEAQIGLSPYGRCSGPFMIALLM